MPDPGLDATTSTSDSEAFEALNQLAGRRTLPIPAEILVGHILALPGPWDWPVRRAAFEALLRRLASARSQELAVIEGPRRGPLGRYALGSPQAAGLLSYDVRLLALDPIEARCDCTDFLRSSLGLCKHVLAVWITWPPARRRPKSPKARWTRRPTNPPPAKWNKGSTLWSRQGQTHPSPSRSASWCRPFEAPPEAASALASLFDGMARLLSTVGSAHASGAEGPRPAMPS
jgi:hypothetical protein